MSNFLWVVGSNDETVYHNSPVFYVLWKMCVTGEQIVVDSFFPGELLIDPKTAEDGECV